MWGGWFFESEEINLYMSCISGQEENLDGYWNFEEGAGNTVLDLTANGNDGVINGATYDSNVPLQSCNLTNVNGCDSTAVLNLTINNSDTSYTDVIACDSYEWNGVVYDSSGVYSYNGADQISGYDYLGSFGSSNYYLSQSYSTWSDAYNNCLTY